MSNHVNEMLMESYFEHAQQNYGLSEDQAVDYAKMRFENEGEALSEGQMRSLMGAPDIDEEGTCMCGENLNDCDDAYSHMTHGV